MAKALALVMKKQGINADCFKVEEAEISKLTEYDMLVIGGPTHKFGMSQSMMEFLKNLP